MAVRQYAALLGILAVTSLGGCSQIINLYHDAEGGAIAKARQPPPGADLPYPNLADVPALPGQASAYQPTPQAGLGGEAEIPAGLALPASPPPPPAIPGLALASGMQQATTPKPAAPHVTVKAVPTHAPVPRPPGPPVVVAFRSGSALLPYSQQRLIEDMARKRGEASVRVCGFGGGGLPLALARARRLGDALTAAGVPADKIELVAIASGSGGFVQFVY